jgi:hypothetical protein
MVKPSSYRHPSKRSGISKSREFWGIIASGNVGKTGERWAPWYNLHETFAGMRDACVAGNKPKLNKP